ncbi:MAG: polysaccharide biosynthesis protein [Alphaproteobacteria bacterium]|nr:polysaccharide biosynthesis protein [Alphaproteobacteria bacterium]MBT4083533.1 polysaccharide biosynthesis protein [Alphaproteobacteria bacterium]MBT4546694.1 polysaccharide biosynthesis protein [Alphaproteobacteria bacterium]MBT7747525.1 polysaccharide biosynthesis protein [Alphaproteobacteria bacterium]
MAALSFEISVLVRYYTYGAPQSPGFLWPATVVFTVVCFIAFWRAGLYRGIWYYASFNDLVAIVKAVTLSILVFLAIMFVATRLQDFPRTALLINWPLLIFLLAGPRFLYRALKDGNWRAAFERDADTRIPVVLVGAGDAAEMFIRDQSRGRNANYRVVGIVDDKPNRIGRDIRGVRVMGTIGELDQVITALDKKGRRPQRLIIASDRIDRMIVRDLLDKADAWGLTLARVPRLTDFANSDNANKPRLVDNGGQLQAIDIADLLGRPRKVLDREAMARLIAGKKVLVTGAGGTIGSELVRQAASFGPAQMTLLDNGEYNLYRIDMEMSEKYPEVPREAVLGDVRDTTRLDQVFAKELPDIVFHAAAFKHVPLNERNPNEAALTNCLGTFNVAEACRNHGVGTMVQISTDKAVNPTNVMGATKRIAEMVCQSLNLARSGGTDTRFVTVRFGNVLGSTGSVVPLFQRQLAAGGPLTVTHPEITRYFMTTGEAVELVLQASAIPEEQTSDAATTEQGNKGEVFVLDMGEPVRIQDLARQMIRLSGLQPDKDVAVEFTGLRPGEKLYEELFHDSEQLVQTGHEGIMLAAPRTIEYAELKTLLDQLNVAATARQTDQTLQVIKTFVPEFESDLTSTPD